MTDSPNHSLNESISALVDGDSNQLDLHRVLKASDSEPDNSVRATWRRYHLIGAVMRGETSAAMGVDLSESIRAAIAAEAVVATPVVGRLRGFGQRWRDVVGKSAIAASVAVAFVVGVQHYGIPQGEGRSAAPNLAAAEGAAARPGTSALPDNVGVPSGLVLPALNARVVSSGGAPAQSSLLPAAVGAGNSGARPGASEAALLQHQLSEAYLQRMLLKHAQHSASSSDFGAVPFVRVSLLEEE